MAENVSEFKVEFGETDMAGIVFYPNYFRWFDRSTHALLESINLPFLGLLEDQNLTVPLVNVGCRFSSPLRYNDKLRLVTKVVEVKERTFKLEHKLYKDEKLVGEGFEVRVLIRTDQQTEEGGLVTANFPPEIAERLIN